MKSFKCARFKALCNCIIRDLVQSCTWCTLHTSSVVILTVDLEQLTCCALINKGTNTRRWLNSVFYFANVARTPLTNGPCSVSSWERSLMQGCSPTWDSEQYTRAWRPPAARRACWEMCSVSSRCLTTDTVHLLPACCCCASAPGLSSASWLTYLFHLHYLEQYVCVCVCVSEVLLLYWFCSWM